MDSGDARTAIGYMINAVASARKDIEKIRSSSLLEMVNKGSLVNIRNSHKFTREPEVDWRDKLVGTGQGTMMILFLVSELAMNGSFETNIAKMHKMFRRVLIDLNLERTAIYQNFAVRDDFAFMLSFLIDESYMCGYYEDNQKNRKELGCEGSCNPNHLTALHHFSLCRLSPEIRVALEDLLMNPVRMAIAHEVNCYKADCKRVVCDPYYN